MESLVSLVLVIIIISALIKLLIYHFSRIDLYIAGHKIPGPRPVLPIIGNAHLFFGTVDKFMSQVIFFDDFKFSPVRFWLGNKLCVILFDPEQMKSVLWSPKAIEKDDLYKILIPFLGQGLLTAPAKKWKVHRKLIMPTFHPKILESFIDAMNEQSEVLVKVMEPEVDGEEIDIYSYISRCTLDILCETAMGVSVNVQTNKDSTYVKAIGRLKEILRHRVLKIWLHSDIIFNSTELAKDQSKSAEYLHGHINKVINQKRQQYFEKNNNEYDVTETGSQRKVFLDLLMELSNEGTKFTDEELLDEVSTMMAAGNDTTAVVNSFFLFMLANFPEIQEKCYQELVEIFGEEIKKGRKVENKDLNRMEYLERVIKETMRLFPPIPVIIRQVTDDLDIAGGYTLPKGSSVVLAICKLHRCEEFWENPLRFDPDRFLPEEIAKRHPCAYAPFSLGSRNCIGFKFAIMSMKVLLTTLLRNYVFVKEKKINLENIIITSEVFTEKSSLLAVKIKRRL